MVTRFYGYYQAERNLSADAELARDREYFAEYKLDVPIAVGDQISVQVQNGQVVYLPGPDPNDTAYKVTGIPQIQLVDRQGRLRLIMIGYDDANEEKLAGVIARLLAEAVVIWYDGYDGDAGTTGARNLHSYHQSIRKEVDLRQFVPGTCRPITLPVVQYRHFTGKPASDIRPYDKY